MCCFAGPVQRVNDTQIFARLSGQGTQALVYQMEFASEAENAMILPLPVATPAAEDSVRFVDLKGYPSFFDDLRAGFPKKPPFQLVRDKSVQVASAAAAPLPVEDVGDYVASFVPAVKDFERLDPRFSISPQVWSKIPGYADFGFAVFQLKSHAGKPHPMAFTFRTRSPETIFFPTVHIHDGLVHESERFDHSLYLQDASYDAVVGEYEDHDVVDPATSLVRSDRPAGAFASVDRSQGILAPDLLLHRRDMRGSFPNTDQVFGFAEASIVPPRVSRWGLRGGAALIAAAGLGWIVARRRKLAQKPG